MNENRKPAGPKKRIERRRTINVSLSDDHIERAREIGKGNISAGLREAVDKYEGNKDEE